MTKPTQQINYRGLNIPFTQLGTKVTTDHLFGQNEQVIFDFYQHNKTRYRRALDIGANIGVHSILMAQQGWEVQAYEPDPVHFDLMLGNIVAHGVRVTTHMKAVSHQDGTETFVRVLDNTTASHLVFARQSYGPREYFDVEIVDCRPLFEWADFAKIDCEGHEAALLLTTNDWTWEHMDALLEIGSIEGARLIYDHLISMVPMWAQKTDWRRVQSFNDMPTRHQVGSLFVGREPPFLDGAKQ